MNEEILTSKAAAELANVTVTYANSMFAAGKWPGWMEAGEWRAVKSQLIEHWRAEAEREQLKRQAQHRAFETAKKDGSIKPTRGRPSKVDTALVVEKYGDMN